MDYRPDQDIFTSGAECVINTVNCRGVMGAGLAKAFAGRFPAILEPYRKVCREGTLRPGGVQLLRLDSRTRERSKEGDLFVANVATKDHWKNPSKIEWVDASLRKLAKALEARGVKSVAIPRLGAGLGGLDWERQVRPLVDKHFSGPSGRGMRVIVLGEGPAREEGTRKGEAVPKKEVTRAYAGIGARNTPDPVLRKMREIGYLMAKEGFTLRSGAAGGADSAFEEGCDRFGGDKEIFLPWPNFNQRKLSEKGIFHEVDRRHEDMARKYHPSWDRLSRGGRALIARNGSQMLGRDLSSPAGVVICYTANGTVKGGTGQVLRMAGDYGVEIVNLGSDRWKNMTAEAIARASVHLAEGGTMKDAIIQAESITTVKKTQDER